MLLAKKNSHIPKTLSTAVVLCILVPNFPGFIYGGDIKAFWMIMSMMVIWLYPQKNFFIYMLLMGIISIPFLFLSFSVKYFLVVFIPFFVFYSLPAFFQLKTGLKILSIAIIATGLLSILGITALNPLFYFIFGEGSGVNATDNIRGSGLISTEPSHIAPLLVLMFASLRYLSFGKSFLIIMIGGLVGTFTTGSGSLLLYMGVYGFILLSKIYNFRVVILISLMISFTLYIGLPGRFLQIINNVVGLSNSGFSLEWTARVASGRFIANYIWLTSIFDNPFGFGFGLEKEWATNRMFELGINPYIMGAYGQYGLLPIMPRSFLAGLAAISGYIGLIGMIVFLIYFIFKNKITDLPLFAVGLVYLLVVGFVGSPYGWIFLMLSINGNFNTLLNVLNTNR
jgi:hypothetical protein